jgi:hypothetical protein
VNSWLRDRQKRTGALVNGLEQFTHLELESVVQSETDADRVRGGAGRRHVHIRGTMARLFAVDVEFDVVEGVAGAGAASPEISHLRVGLPAWLEDTLNGERNHLARLVRRNDLPAVLLTLRTLVTLAAVRRNTFAALMERYTALARAHVRAWEAASRVAFQPWHPRARSRTSAPDDLLARSLLLPSHAQTLTLRNHNDAALTIHFRIHFNRFGHATPELSLQPHVPDHLITPAAAPFLTSLDSHFQHLLKVAVSQKDGLVQLPDTDTDAETDDAAGKFGVLPPLHATIQAFFGLQRQPAHRQALDQDRAEGNN